MQFSISFFVTLNVCLKIFISMNWLYSITNYACGKKQPISCVNCSIIANLNETALPLQLDLICSSCFRYCLKRFSSDYNTDTKV